MSLEEYEGRYLVYDIEGSDHYVIPHCPNCGRFIKTGSIWVNGAGNTKAKGFNCKKCGEIEPERFFV